MHDLTARQIEIVVLVAEGLSNVEIGERLHLSEDTIKTHVRRVMLAWKARNRAHCVHIAHRLGLLGDPWEAAGLPPEVGQAAPAASPRVQNATLFRKVGMIHQAVTSAGASS